ncbi:DegT/DnrJ/EryC1/StrS family aminotransferase [Pelagibacteraceae bacterium]|nr:DegT/DnrJ/EryC1/StrS family aminotransferase [Pelagibacteraceae bacterium]
MIKTWSYKEEYQKHRKVILKSIDKTLLSGDLFFGSQLKKFENTFVKLNKAKYGIAVGSGTDALIISLKALGIGKNINDEVITVSNTAIPTASAITSAGAKPIFVDIGKDYLINTSKIKKAINKNTKAIIPVHLYGQPCKMDEILKLAKRYNLKIIEDCAQAQGSKYRNKFVGTFGNFGCFSFYPTKILGAYGDGGFITTNSYKMLQTIKRLRFYGIEQNNKKNKFNRIYYSNEHGLNSRLDEIHCSILNIKIKQVEYFIKKRRQLANIYNKELSNTSLVLPKENSDSKHVYHLYTVYHPKRERIIKELEKKKIKVNIYYPYPIHKMKGYKNKKNRYLNLNLTNKVYKGIFSLPLYPDLKINDIKRITKILKQILIKV